MKAARKTKWQVALDVVTREIESGDFPPGSAFYSIRELCDRFDCSSITAARVFDKLKTRGLLRTNGRQGATVLAGIRPETVYLALSTDLVTAGQSSRFLCAVMEGFQRQPLATAFRVKPVSLDFCLVHPKAIAKAPMIILQGALFDAEFNRACLNHKRADDVLERFNPIVFQTCIPLPGFTEVGCDMRGAIAEMVGLLHGIGHRRIAYLGGDAAALWFRSRFDGYLDGLQRHELALDPALVAFTQGLDAQEDEAAISRLLALSDPPTALVCVNETRALNVLAFCSRNGIRVPAQLSVTAFGNVPETALSVPPLTTHDPCDADMGYAALELLHERRLGRLKEPATVTIRPKLILRASHAPRQKR